MITTCEKCGIQYNNRTIQQCPLCFPFHRKQMIVYETIEGKSIEQYNKEQQMNKEIKRFRLDNLDESKKIVRSYQNSLKQPKGYHIDS